jgi:RecA-family ATPase
MAIVGVYSGDEYMALPRPVHPWLIEGILPTSAMLTIYGKPKASKSMVGLQLASAVANPAVDEVLGHSVLDHGLVYYIQLDTPRSIWAERFCTLKTAGWCFSRVYVTDPDSESLPFPFDMSINGSDWITQKLHELPEFPKLVVLDTVREAHSGDENDSGQMKRLVALCQHIVRPAALMLIAHARKSNGDREDDLMDGARGSSYVAGRADVVMRIDHVSEHKRRMLYGGRKTDEASFLLDKARDTGILSIADDAVVTARKVMKAHPTWGASEVARAVQDEHKGKTFQACRMIVARIKRGVEDRISLRKDENGAEDD